MHAIGHCSYNKIYKLDIHEFHTTEHYITYLGYIAYKY